MNFDLIIVDDDPEYVYFHKLLAKKAGISEDPLTFSGGREVIHYLNGIKDQDFKNILIFLDIYMMGVDGWGVLDFIESLGYPDKLKVVLISSSVSYADKSKAIHYHSVIEYIEKPLMLNYLIQLKTLTIF